MVAADDLPEALADPARRMARGGCTSTCRCISHPGRRSPRRPRCCTAALAAVRELPHGDEAHLDVETYTWTVLPDPVDDLVTGIAGELRWASEHLLGNATEPAHATSVPVEPVPAEVPA